MTSNDDYFVAESHGGLGVLRLKPHGGAALSEISYSHAVLNAIREFEAESKSVLLILVPAGSFAPDRLETFWDNARHGKPDERVARHSHPTSLPIEVERQENGVILLLELLQKTTLFKIIAVEGAVDFDMLGLLLAFDVRFCGRTTIFQNRIIDRAVTPGYGVLWYLSRHLGAQVTLDLILNQRSVNSEDALQLKLVTHVTDDIALPEEAIKYANEISAKPIAVIRALVRATELVSCSFETYLEQVGGGFRRIPPS
jgi:hypothetical protein